MAINITTGPSIVSGSTNPVQNSEPDQGPSLTFQGAGLIDPRYVANIGAAPGTKIFGMYSNSYVVSTDATPVILSTTRLSAAVAPAAGVAIALVTAQAAGVSPAMPVLPFNASAVSTNLVSGISLDFGFTVANSSVGTKTLTIPAGAWRYFYAGQRIVVAGAGASGGNLFTTVAAAAVPNVTTITIADNALTSTNGCQVGSNHPTLNCAWPFLIAGAISLFDPTQGIARAVTLTANAAATTNPTLVRGYDVYGQPMSELITAVAASTVSGKKAFKVITSVTPTITDAGHTISVGTSDVYGINFRADYWEYMDIFFAGAFVSVSTGWVVSDATPVATNATGDVRGTYLLQSASNGDGTVTNWAAAKRLAIFSSLPMFNTVNATNLNYQTMYGSTQA